jgi:lysozyme
MRRLALLLLPLLFLFVGCGGGRSSSPSPSQPATPAPVVTYLPPQSSIVPEGAKPEAPPVSLPFTTGPVMHVDAAGVRLILGFEGFSSCPYWDFYGHVWTRGAGETEGIGPHSPCISRSTGEARLRYLVEARYEWAIRGLGVTLNQHRWNSLCSTLWNLGAGIVGVGTQLGDLLRARNWQGYASALRQYDHAGGVVLPGLRTRREIEARLFLTPEPQPEPKPRPSRRQLLRLRADLTRHRCRVAPYHGRGRYHQICARWRAEGAAVNRALR